jgi:hypothetical protein
MTPDAQNIRLQFKKQAQKPAQKPAQNKHNRNTYDLSAAPSMSAW